MNREEALDAVAFSLDERTCKSPEEYKEMAGETWFRKHTRNHAIVKGGITREVPQKGEWWDIDDHHNDALTPLLAGRVIVSVQREPCSGEDWELGANTVVITLDDGSRLRFDGSGYDASGCDMSFSPARRGG